jgi:hypothetical protein
MQDFGAMMRQLMQGAQPVNDGTRQMPPQPGFNNGPYFDPQQLQQLQALQQQYKLSPVQMRDLIEKAMRGGR